MKKIIACFLVIFILLTSAFVLSSCGEDETEPNGPVQLPFVPAT